MAKGPKPYPVRVRGVDYDSAESCAAALGVALCTVYYAVGRGATDTLGLGSGKHKNHAKCASKPFSIGGLEFPSQQAASVALGFHKNYIEKVKRERRPTDRLIAAAMAYRARKELEATAQAWSRKVA